MNRVAVGAAFAIALAGCGERVDAPVTCPVQDARRSASGALFVRCTTTPANDAAMRWMRDAGCVDGWIELAASEAGRPLAQADDLLDEAVWAVAIARDERAQDWRPYPLDACTVTIGSLRPRLAPTVVPAADAPIAWLAVLTSQFDAATAADRQRLQRFESFAWEALGVIPSGMATDPTAWLDASDRISAHAAADGVLLARCRSPDGWRDECWLRVPVALLDSSLSLSRTDRGAAGVLQQARPARFRAPPVDAVASAPPLGPLVVRSIGDAAETGGGEVALLFPVEIVAEMLSAFAHR